MWITIVYIWYLNLLKTVNHKSTVAGDYISKVSYKMNCFVFLALSFIFKWLLKVGFGSQTCFVELSFQVQGTVKQRKNESTISIPFQ